jgi:hypothetical protein
VAVAVVVLDQIQHKFLVELAQQLMEMAVVEKEIRAALAAREMGLDMLEELD